MNNEESHFSADFNTILWNTIIEVRYIYSEYEEVKTLLLETAAEISERIDILSH